MITVSRVETKYVLHRQLGKTFYIDMGQASYLSSSMALRTASLMLFALATSLKEILWDSSLLLSVPGDSIVSVVLSPSDFIYNPFKRFSKNHYQ